ncbi:MAG: hypoxanthine phosphoribosyltransferase [candidate division WOR-3 bacterium]
MSASTAHVRISTLVTAEQIDARVREIAGLISHDHAGTELLVIGVLKGSWVFLADLVRQVTIPLLVNFVAVSSYGDGTYSSGSVKLLMEPDCEVEGRDILVVDDILDTGLTLKFVMDRIRHRRPHSLKLCVLLDKPQRRQVEIKPDYVGFRIPDRFVVGYGLDHNQRFRNLPFIGYISQTE